MSTATTRKAPWHTGRELANMVGEGRQKAEEAGHLMGVSANTVYRWMNEPALPDRIVRKIADAYGVAEQWLSSGTGAKFGETEVKEAALERRLERIIVIHVRQYERDIRRLIGRSVKIVSGMDVLDGGDGEG